MLNIVIHFLNKKSIAMQSEADEKVIALVGRINTATNTIADKIKTVLEGEKDNLSPESISALTSAVEGLEKIGADGEDSIPPAE